MFWLLGRKIPFYNEMDFSRDQNTAEERESFLSTMVLLLVNEFLSPSHTVHFHVPLTDQDTEQPPTLPWTPPMLPPNSALTIYMICAHTPGCRGVRGYVGKAGTPAAICGWESQRDWRGIIGVTGEFTYLWGAWWDRLYLFVCVYGVGGVVLKIQICLIQSIIIFSCYITLFISWNSGHL